MKRLSSLAILGLLAACNPTPASESTADDTVGTAPVETPMDAATHAVTSANGSPVGTYSVTRSDGSTVFATINASGTYEVKDKDDKIFETGDWEVKEGKTCFTPSATDTSTVCYTETAPAADGSFTATPDVGDPEQVKPVKTAM